MTSHHRSTVARDAGHLLVGNLGATAVMAVLVLVLPRFVSLTTYGYWQLYLFYATYLGYVTFGVPEGLYLRFSGGRLEELPRGIVGTHLGALAVLNVFLVGAVLAGGAAFGMSGERRIVVVLVCASTFLVGLRSLLTYVYQASGNMRVYAHAFLLERGVLLTGAVLLLVVGRLSLVALLLMEVAGRTAGLIYSLWTARVLLAQGLMPWRRGLRELGASMAGGLFVEVSAIATVLVTAVARFGTERGFGVAVFAELALAFSLVNMVQTIVGSVGLAVLPSLRRAPRERFGSIYTHAESLVMSVMVLMLVAFVPLAALVHWWLPDYGRLVVYLGVLFPMIVFETRTRLFAIPFLQALRRERYLAAANVISLALAVGLTGIAVIVLRDPVATAASLTVAVAVRAVILEVVLRRALSLSMGWRPSTEIAVCLLFIIATVGTLGWLGLALMAVALIAFGVTNAGPLGTAFRMVARRDSSAAAATLGSA